MYRPCLHCEGKQYDENYCPEICQYGEARKQLKELEAKIAQDEPTERSIDSESHFVEGVRPEDNYLEILNWYRNLYHAENPDTERGVMARAINDLFMAMKQGTAEDLFYLKAKERTVQ